MEIAELIPLMTKMKLVAKVLLIFAVIATVTLFSLGLPILAADPELEKAPIELQPKDTKLLDYLAEAGINKEYVKLDKDYGSRLEGKSPYSVTYKDIKSNNYYMLISGLPQTDAFGVKLCPTWEGKEGKFYSGYNLFEAVIDGNIITVSLNFDQPNGSKKGDWVTWDPQLFINSKEIQPRALPILLAVDPINPSYLNNTIEWDYGSGIKRTVRVIEGRISEWWTFAYNPQGEVRIKHNITGNLPLVLGRGSDANIESIEITVTDDVETISKEELAKAFYPIQIGASPETFYPDPHAEVSSVDGQIYDDDTTSTWNDKVEHIGTGASDTFATINTFKIHATATEDQWTELFRSAFLFNTAGLPDGCTITGAVLSLYGTGKTDDLSASPKMNIFSVDPASNVQLVAGDFDSFGTEALSTAITYASWNTSGYNNFTLIDVNSDGFATYNVSDTYINKTGVTKLGGRETEYDVAEELDPGNHTPPWVSGDYSRFLCHAADQGGTGSDPKLIVTYTLLSPPPPPPPSPPTGLTLTAISDTEIKATWDIVSGDNITYLLLVSTAAYPDDPTGNYAEAYSGNATSVDLIGFNMELTIYYFSLWTNKNPYSADYTTAEIGVTDIADELANLNTILQNIAQFLPLVLFSFLAFWRPCPVLFMLTGATALFYGFYWFDTYVTNQGLAVSLAIIAYAFLCMGMALRLIFWHEEVE